MLSYLVFPVDHRALDVALLSGLLSLPSCMPKPWFSTKLHPWLQHPALCCMFANDSEVFKDAGSNSWWKAEDGRNKNREELTAVCNFTTILPCKKRSQSSCFICQNHFYSLWRPEEGINGHLLTNWILLIHQQTSVFGRRSLCWSVVKK